MMNIKKLIILGLLQVCLFSFVQAQDAGDFTATALDLSRTYSGGTARMQGIGGAQTALGGDISASAANPAGLGFFNRSVFTFSPTLNFVNSTSDYLGTTTNDNKINLNFANLGVVFNKSRGGLSNNKWKGGSIGLSMTRVADFQNQVEYQGENVQGDFLDFALDSDNFYGSNDLSDLAFNTYLTDEFYELYSGQETININGRDENVAELYGSNLNNGDTLFFYDRNIYAMENGSYVLDENGNKIPAFPEDNYPTFQSEVVNSEGAVYKTTFAYGGNYNDQIYFGAALGVMSVNRNVERTFIEEPTSTDLNNMVITDNYEISGAGINATFGIIARPITPLLVGLSYVTPTYYGLEQVRELVVVSNFYDESYEDGILYTPFNYNMTTPSRLSGGLTYFFGKSGFISADVEHVNYSKAKLSNPSDNISFNEDNQSINRFESIYNYRVGGEYRFSQFRLRAGYAYYADPTKYDNLDQSESTISLGAGIRNEKMFFDIGIVNSLGKKSTISPYPDAPVAEINNQNTSAIFSVGFFF